MKRLFLILIGCGMIILSLAVVVILAMNRPAPDKREPPETAMLVETMPARVSQENFTVTSQGTVRPRTRTSIVSEVSGMLVELNDDFVAGGFFEAGEMLARIDPSDYEAALLQAEAELASAQATLADEKARSEQARRDWQRLHSNEGEPNDLVLRLPQLQGARAAVQAAEAAVMRARRNLERTRIRLPYDGLVTERQVDLGQYVSPGSTLGVAFAVDIAEVRLPLSDRDTAYLDLPEPGRPGQTGPTVTLAAEVDGTPATWQGRIVRTEGVVDESTRLTYAVARVTDPYGLLGERRGTPLQMGTFVNARIEGESSAGLISLPRTTVHAGDRVYVANAEDKLEIRDVAVIRSTPEKVYVADSLEAGERIVTTAIQTPIPGMALRIRDTDGENGDEPVLRLLPAGELAASEANGSADDAGSDEQ